MLSQRDSKKKDKERTRNIVEKSEQEGWGGGTCTCREMDK